MYRHIHLCYTRMYLSPRQIMDPGGGFGIISGGVLRYQVLASMAFIKCHPRGDAESLGILRKGPPETSHERGKSVGVYMIICLVIRVCMLMAYTCMCTHSHIVSIRDS